MRTSHLYDTTVSKEKHPLLPLSREAANRGACTLCRNNTNEQAPHARYREAGSTQGRSPLLCATLRDQEVQTRGTLWVKRQGATDSRAGAETSRPPQSLCVPARRTQKHQPAGW